MTDLPKEDKEFIKSKGMVIKFPDGLKGYLAFGKKCPPYAILTNKKAWCDKNNVVHLGEPKV